MRIRILPFERQVLKDNKCHVTTRGKSYNIDNNSFGRGLVMASLNINSLLAHIDQLRVVMSNSEIDILSINEKENYTCPVLK